jgi:hypothetical protein
VPDGNESWDPLLSTEDELYRAPDGAAKGNAATSEDDKITLPPYTAALFRREQQ